MDNSIDKVAQGFFISLLVCSFINDSYIIIDNLFKNKHVKKKVNHLSHVYKVVSNIAFNNYKNDEEGNIIIDDPSKDEEDNDSIDEEDNKELEELNEKLNNELIHQEEKIESHESISESPVQEKEEQAQESILELHIQEEQVQETVELLAQYGSNPFSDAELHQCVKHKSKNTQKSKNEIHNNSNINNSLKSHSQEILNNEENKQLNRKNKDSQILNKNIKEKITKKNKSKKNNDN
jgi:hypothetical protein